MKQIMKPLYLRFDSERSAIDALTANGFSLNEDGSLYHESALIDVVGVISGATILNVGGEIIGNEPDLVGWHVNLLVPDNVVPPKSATVVEVKTPVRRWAGY